MSGVIRMVIDSWWLAGSCMASGQNGKRHGNRCARRPGIPGTRRGAALFAKLHFVLDVVAIRSLRFFPGESIMSSLRSEEHTSELQSLMRISYAVFCLKKKKKIEHTI